MTPRQIQRHFRAKRDADAEAHEEAAFMAWLNAMLQRGKRLPKWEALAQKLKLRSTRSPKKTRDQLHEDWVYLRKRLG